MEDHESPDRPCSGPKKSVLGVVLMSRLGTAAVVGEKCLVVVCSAIISTNREKKKSGCFLKNRRRRCHKVAPNALFCAGWGCDQSDANLTGTVDW